MRSRIISQDKDKHQVKMIPVAKKSDTNNKLALFKLTLLDQIMNTQIKSSFKQDADSSKLNDSSDNMPSEDNYDLINVHNVNKRSPGCLLWCLKKRILHPAQCHFYCRFSG